MTDLQAAIGSVQLKRLPEMLRRRRELVARYQKLLRKVEGIGLPQEPPWARSNWQSYCVRLPEGCDQERVMQVLLDAGIATRRGVMCAHREPAYKTEPWACSASGSQHRCASSTCEKLKESQTAQDRSVILPLFYDMTQDEQDRVVDAFSEACASPAAKR